MLWVAIFTENPSADAAAIRQAQKEPHFAYLRENRERIRFAGALRTAPGQAPEGGLWVFEAESRAEVEEIIAADPYFRAGLSAEVRICTWGPPAAGLDGVTY